MFKWFKNLSRETSKRNIGAQLDEVIQAANMVAKCIGEGVMVTERQAQFVTDAQKRMLFELHGPLTMNEAFYGVIQPRLKKGGLSDQAFLAVQAVLEVAVREIGDGTYELPK